MSTNPQPAIPIPDRLALRPKYAGLPILYTTLITNKVPDFRINDPDRTYNVFRYHKCAVCGQPLDKPVFLVGPHVKEMRITPEPPTHAECIRYALQVCPYLSRRKARSSRPPHPEAITDVYHEPRLPETAWLGWTSGYRLTLQEDIWYAVCAPWTRLEKI